MDFITEAVRIAERSTMYKHRTGAVIVHKRKIISNGWSHYPRIPTRLRSLHAEMHAIARARHLRLKELSDVRIYIATLTKGGNVVSGRPCLHCAIGLHSLGIEVCFSDPDVGYSWLILPDELEDLKVYQPCQ